MRLTHRFLIATSIILFISCPAFSQTIEKVKLVEPASGQISANKPVFKILVEGDDLGPSIKYKLELSSDNFETIYRSFEQVNDRKGWVNHELYSDDASEITEKGALYRVQEALPDGVYQWKAAAYDGMTYHDSDSTSTFIVDSVPPADVSGLMLVFDHKTGMTHLFWNPVLMDINGRSENVDHYNIYRYEKRSFFFIIRVFFIGSSERESFIDKDINKNSLGRVLFYKVVAVDKAGNELGRRF